MEQSRLDTFTLLTYQNIDIDERNVVTLLYAPLIGKDAFSLYLTLWSLIDRSKLKSPTYTHRKLYDILDFHPTAYLAARKKLEAIGLLDVYQNQDNYLYELKAPLSANEFINDGSLGSYLFTKIGKENFDELTNLFKISNIEKAGFKNISASFDDVFDSITSSITTNETYISRSKSKININHDFDFDFFLEGLSKNFVDRRRITEKIKEKIINLSYIYNLDEITMQKVFMDSVNTDRSINLDSMSISAKRWHEYTVPDTFTSKKDKKSIKTLTDIDHFDLVNTKKICKEYTPSDLISLASGHPATASEMRTIERAFEEFDYPSELINFIIIYAFVTNESLPTFNYLEKVYAGWKRNNVTSIEEAIEAIKSFKKRATTKKKSNQKEDLESDWLDDYIKNF